MNLLRRELVNVWRDLRGFLTPFALTFTGITIGPWFIGVVHSRHAGD